LTAVAVTQPPARAAGSRKEQDAMTSTHITQRPGSNTTTARPIRLAVIGVFLACLTLIVPHAGAATVYANFLTIDQIVYAASGDTYLVRFNGTPFSTSETDDLGTPCDDFSGVVIRSSTKGVNTEDPAKVDRLITQLNIAWATGAEVKLWVHRCDVHATNPKTYPKGYLVVIR
jgi:hypothetical protein